MVHIFLKFALIIACCGAAGAGAQLVAGTTDSSATPVPSSVARPESPSPSPSPTPAASAKPEPAKPKAMPGYKVTAVQDGDTIAVSTPTGAPEAVRLAGINAAELAEGNLPSQCFAIESTAKLTKDLLGKTVSLAPDPAQKDRDPKNRLLRYVELADGRDYNLLLIAEGYVKEMTYHSTPHSRQTAYQKAQEAAEAGQKGLWSPQTCGGDMQRPGIFLQRPAFGAVKPNGAGQPTCASFRTREQAQRFYEFNGGPFQDKYGLDSRRNGRACEQLPFASAGSLHRVAKAPKPTPTREQPRQTTPSAPVPLPVPSPSPVLTD